jgi:hypothetical protein
MKGKPKNNKRQDFPHVRPDSCRVLNEADKQFAKFLATRSDPKRVVKPRLELRLYGLHWFEEREVGKLMFDCLARLPAKITKRVLDEVFFIFIPKRVFGFVIGIPSPSGSTQTPVITINWAKLCSKSYRCRMVILAKEIARVMLGQLKYSESPVEDEEKALELISKWGFDPELYKRCTTLIGPITKRKNLAFNPM